MRIAVLSDIHGNLRALKAVLRDAQHEQVDQYWCLGDVVGYGPYPLECYEELKGLKAEGLIPESGWIVGNHDWGLIGRIPEGVMGAHFNPYAWWSLEQSRILMTRHDRTGQRFEEMCDFLNGLPTFIESPEPGIWLMHGRVVQKDSGDHVDEKANIAGANSYIYPWEESHGTRAESSWQALKRLAANEDHIPSVILAGHSHIPLLWRRQVAHDGEGQWRADQERLLSRGRPALRDWECPRCGEGLKGCRGLRWEGSIPLEPGPVLINPGSVGQPRDGCPAAAYAILDLGHRRTVLFKRVGYDIAATQDAFYRLAWDGQGDLDHSAIDKFIAPLQKRLEEGQ